MNSMKTVTFNDGLTIPAIGFGTYLLNGAEGAESIKNAVELGYRLIDSAFNYENEGAVGEAVRRTSVPREELFITSKLPGRRHEYGQALKTVEESLFRAGLSHYDLYLIHWPNPLEDRYVGAWQALIEARKRGYIRSIGVCNFLPEHLERLEKETGVVPAVNQIELHPYFNQMEQLAWHREHGIVIQAWTPLGRGNDMLSGRIITGIANVRQKSASQVVLRWHIQHGAVPVPKASSREHQLENLNVFDFSLSDEDMAALDSLTRADGRTSGQDPAVYQEF
ncbi:aldo/keto reductase [Lachnospiraceae bacterium 54-53]